jgi:carboxyl-terminal processing protease
MIRKSALLVLTVLSLGAASQAIAQPPSAKPPQSGPGAISPLVASNKTTSAQLEEIYDDVWFQLGETYIDTVRLGDWDLWRHKYDGKMKTEEDLDHALSAMTASLGDKWTDYESSHQRLLEVFASVRGLVDLGIDVSADAAGNQVVRIAPFGSFARDNGLVAGDILESVNGKTLRGHSAVEIAEIMRFPVTKSATVEYIHDGEKHSVTFKATPSVKPMAEARMLDNGIMYTRLSSFRDGPTDIGVLNNAVTALLATCKCSPRGMILDLRGNPGGSFELVLKEAAFFMPGKVIVGSTTREGNLVTSSTYHAQPLTSFESSSLSEPQRKMIDVFTNAPLVVLVDSSTASAAELFTGAVKDNGRGLIVGTRTYGKGVGFQEIDVKLGGQLMVTKLKYMTPLGFDVSTGGITPDVVVPAESGAVASLANPATDKQLAVGLDELEKRIASRR